MTLKIGDKIRVLKLALIPKKKEPVAYAEVETVIRRADGSIKEVTTERTPIHIGSGKTEIITGSGGEK
jgi:hypothetical protein